MSAVATISCPACGASNSAGARFCNQCTAALGNVTAPSPASAERKQVTVLFSDLTGFTALSERLDPEETREIMNRVFGRAAEVIARYDGRIEKFVGDAIMAIFGVPLAHEDDPVRAVRAACELHEAVASLSPQVQERTGTPIALHSGINTGLVVTGEIRFDHGTAGPLGDTINLAARLMGAAPGGEIWVGPATRGLVSGAFELEDLGVHEFKGKTGSIAVARVLGALSRNVTVIQFRGTFVGREAELGELLDAAERIRDGVPSVIGICGDAGTGKTRLVAEFRAKVGDDTQWLEGRAYPYAQSIPYAPIIDLLSRSWAIEEGNSPAEVRARIKAAVSDLVVAPGEVLPLLLHLFNLPQSEGVVIEREAFQDRLLNAMRQLLTALALRAPTVICLQDLHWADTSTAILLQGLCKDLRIPVLLLGNYRPGFSPPPATTVLELSELSPRQTAELLASLLKDQPPEELTRFIEARSDGNPFYVEEVVNSLVETGVLTRDSHGWKLTRPLSEAGVPTTVTGVIAARIDRLDEPRRRVLRHAAVVGREFLYAIVAQIMQDRADLAPSLKDLEAVDLIRIRHPKPDLEYIFKHALTHEVAYDGLLKSERRQLHARAALAMEAVLIDRIGEFVETLAYHFLRGGVIDKAVHYLAAAGRKCVARYALREAAVHFREAYKLIAESERGPEESRVLAQLLVSWSQVHYYDGTIGEWRRLLEKHLEDAERCGEPAVLAMYLGWLGNVRAFHGDMRGSLQALERALEVAQSVDAHDALAHALAWQTFTLFDCGRAAGAIRAAQSLRRSDEENRSNPYPYVKGQGGLAMAFMLSGKLRPAREPALGLVEFGRASGNARAEAMGHYVLAWQQVIALDFERAGESAQAGIDAARDPMFTSMNAVVLAVALAADARFDAAARVCDAWLPYLAQSENRWFELPLRVVRATTELVAGRLDAGLRGILGGIDDLQQRGHAGLSHLAEIFLLFTYVSVARRDVKPALGAILRNPRFVLTQVPFAARNAYRLIERLRFEAEQKDLRGILGLVDLCAGRMLAHQGKKAQAHEVVARIRRRLDDAGIEHLPAPLLGLIAEVAALTS